jgi:3'(2'),5'-bisphosphate nucleotidase
MDPALALAAITFAAAIVNGALGYGFSSITVPLTLLFLSNRVLNPALVLIEIPLNAYVLWVNRDALGRVWRRVILIIAGLLPGVAIGTLIVADMHPGWLRLGIFTILLPLILLQAGGLRHPIAAERGIGLPFGCGLGVLYAVTTISGPPLALLLNNQGFARQDFRAALATIRLAESSLTGMAYLSAGLFIASSPGLVPYIIPSVLVGVPIGTWLIRRVRVETFRRICMSVDAWIVGFGISTLLRELHIVDSRAAYAVLAVVALIDGWLLYRFGAQPPAEGREPPPAGGVAVSRETLDSLVRLVQRAGQEIRAAGSRGMEIEADGSPVTRADRAAHAIICRGLAVLDASIPIVSEEAPEPRHADRSGWHRYWLVDPLDGTKEFLAGRPEYTVNIALIDHGEPVLGVVGAPALQTIYFAGRRLGSWRRTEHEPDTRLSTHPPAPGARLRVVESRSHPSPELERYLAQFPIGERIAIGSSLKFCRIAEGLADCYPRLGPTMAWDVAAGDCVFRNACDGPVPHASPLRYDARDFRQAGFVIGFVPRGVDAPWRTEDLSEHAAQGVEPHW